MESEIGKRYGRLVVVEKLDKRYFITTVYKCLCNCGNYVELNINKLHTVHTKSCGCLKNSIKHGLTGQRFGRLVVDEFAYRKKNKTYWKCKCDCGKECFVCSPNLLGEFTISCGCKNEENKKALLTYDRGLVDGTMLSAIDGSRKMNKNNHSGHVGVHYDKSKKKKWAAQITFQRKHIFLGRYDTIEETIEVRKAAEDKYFGKYRNKGE